MSLPGTPHRGAARARPTQLAPTSSRPRRATRRAGLSFLPSRFRTARTASGNAAATEMTEASVAVWQYPHSALFSAHSSWPSFTATAASVTALAASAIGRAGWVSARCFPPALGEHGRGRVAQQHQRASGVSNRLYAYGDLSTFVASKYIWTGSRAAA